MSTMQAAALTGRREVIVDTRGSSDLAAVTVGSVSDQNWYISRTHGMYHIPACKKEDAFAKLRIEPRTDMIDLGDNRRLPLTIGAREIAEDLLQDLHDHGVFLCAGDEPTAAEIAAARARSEAFHHKLVAEADVMWARGHSFREISDLHRRAAIALGLEREWAYVPVRMSDCPACGEKVKPGVAVCRHCSAILDAEKAAKHGLGLGARQAQSGGRESAADETVNARTSARRNSSRA
jgi:hypothetical protein